MPPSVMQRASDVDPGAWFAIAFVVVVSLLSVYSWRHWSKRAKALAELMMRRGFTVIDEPSDRELVPESLFHPNGFDESSVKGGRIEDVIRRVPRAWSGCLGGDLDVVLMDVSVTRRSADVAENRDHTKQLNRTVLCCSVPDGSSPPDLLVAERVLFKRQVKNQRSVDGRDEFGQHYRLFSAASDLELRPWIGPRMLATLSRFRLFSLAVHDGRIYVARGSSVEGAHQIDSFLREAEALIRALICDGQEQRSVA